jgi:hypothetical protein
METVIFLRSEEAHLLPPLRYAAASPPSSDADV